jgi:hypothetical protein
MNTETLTQTIKERFDHAATKQILKEKYEAKLIFAEAGGMWKASPTLINILSAFDDDNLVLIDEYNNPCEVNRDDLLTTAKEHYREQLNAWYVEHNKLSRQR